jgi:hypothetical protein
MKYHLYAAMGTVVPQKYPPPWAALCSLSRCIAGILTIGRASALVLFECLSSTSETPTC